MKNTTKERSIFLMDLKLKVKRINRKIYIFDKYGLIEIIEERGKNNAKTEKRETI
jgi:hypothetical protein